MMGRWMRLVSRARPSTLALKLCVGALICAPVLAQPPECDRDCLTGLMDRYLAALVAREPASLPWAESVRFTENDVALMVGDGLWGTATEIGRGYTVADPAQGNVLWLGIVEEHGQAAYLALRLGVEGRRIAEIESVLGREGTPAPFAPTAGYTVDPAFSEPVPRAERLPRGRLEALVAGYYDTLQLNDGTVQTQIADDCVRLTNGFSTTHAPGLDVTGCRQQLEIGWYRYIDRVRARRFPIIDAERGVVVAIAFLDQAARYVEYETLDGRDRRIPIEYPNSHGVLELFKIEDGKIRRIEGVTSFQPYLMPTKWVP
jgi:hypothetical protein